MKKFLENTIWIAWFWLIASTVAFPVAATKDALEGEIAGMIAGVGMMTYMGALFLFILIGAVTEGAKGEAEFAERPSIFSFLGISILSFLAIMMALRIFGFLLDQASLGMTMMGYN